MTYKELFDSIERLGLHKLTDDEIRTLSNLLIEVYEEGYSNGQRDMEGKYLTHAAKKSAHQTLGLSGLDKK